MHLTDFAIRESNLRGVKLAAFRPRPEVHLIVKPENLVVRAHERPRPRVVALLEAVCRRVAREVPGRAKLADGYQWHHHLLVPVLA